MTQKKEFYILSELAERWGTSRQNVYKRTVRRKDFPRPHHVLGTSDKKMPVYHIDDIELYEEKHGIKVKGEEG